MANIEKVAFLSADELEKITAETVSADVATASHLDKLDRQIKALEAERKKIASALLEKWNHTKPENSVFKVSIYDYYKFNESEFKKENPEEHEKYKTQLVHVEKVSG